MTPITVNVEDFVQGPATEVHKLNLFAEAIRELQAAVRELQDVQGNAVFFPVTRLQFEENGEIVSYDVYARFAGTGAGA